MLSPGNIKRKLREAQQMTPAELFLGFFKLFFYGFFYGGKAIYRIIKWIVMFIINIMRGPKPEKLEVEVPVDSNYMAPMKVFYYCSSTVELVV